MNLSKAQVVRVYVVFALAYFMSYALRSVQAVIATPLTTEFRLNNADLGLLSSTYLLSFACMQWPLGIWLDKYGSRRVESALLLLAGLGCVVFANSHALQGLMIGRALIGVGVSACLMGAYAFFRQWMSAERQGQAGPLMLMAGTSGAVASTLPATMLMDAVGWRGLFVVCAVMLVVLAVGLFWLLPKEADQVEQPTAQAHPRGAYWIILTDPGFIRAMPLAIFTQGGWIALQTLWLGPWLQQAVGLSEDASSRTLFYFNLALLLAYGLATFATTRFPRLPLPRIFMPGFAFMTVCMLVAILWVGPESQWLWPVIALGVPATALLQTYTAMGAPKAFAGRALTTFNLLIFVGAFAVQWGLGILIDWLIVSGWSVRMAYQGAFFLLWAAQLLAVAWYALRPARS